MAEEDKTPGSEPPVSREETPENRDTEEIAIFREMITKHGAGDTIIGNGPRRRVIQLADADVETLIKIDKTLVEFQKRSKEATWRTMQEEETEKRIKQITSLSTGFSELDLEEQIKNPDDAFGFIANHYLELQNQNRVLETARIKLEAAETSRRLIDKTFISSLERSVTNFFLRLGKFDDGQKKKDRIEGYENVFQSYLKKKYSEGFEIEKKEFGMKITFSDVGVAAGFYKFFTGMRDNLEDEMTKFQTKVYFKLKEKGLGEIISELNASDIDRRIEERRITSQATRGELEALEREQLISHYISLQEELAKLREENQKFKEGGDAYNKERQENEEIIGGLRNTMTSLEKLAKSSSIIILQSLKAAGDYLREQNEVCDFGYDIPGTGKPEEYLGLVLSGINKFAERIKDMAGRLVQLKNSHESLLEKHEALAEIAPKEFQQFKRLFASASTMSNIFYEYFSKYDAGGFDSLKIGSPKLMPTDELITYYLAMLKSSLDLIDHEVKYYDLAKEILEKKQKLAENYNCESGKKLNIKFFKMRKYARALEREAELETRMARYASEDSEHGPEHDSYNELVLSLSQMATVKHDFVSLAQGLDPKVKDEKDAKRLYHSIETEMRLLKEKQKEIPKNLVYNDITAKFDVLAQLGKILGAEADSYVQLKDSLSREKERYEACAMGYKLINGIMLGKPADNPKSL